MGIKNEDEFVAKHFIVLSIAFIILLVVTVIGVTYAIFIYSGVGTKENKVSTGSIVFNYIESTRGISIQNSLPITDAVGKTLQKSDSNGGSQGYIDFNISCKIIGSSSVSYEVYAVNSEVENPISSDYVKIYLTNGDEEIPYTGYDSNAVPTYGELPVSEADPAGRRIYYGTFNESGSQKFRLRMWLADNYVVNDDKKKFTIKINTSAKE